MNRKIETCTREAGGRIARCQEGHRKGMEVRGPGEGQGSHELRMDAKCKIPEKSQVVGGARSENKNLLRVSDKQAAKCKCQGQRASPVAQW